MKFLLSVVVTLMLSGTALAQDQNFIKSVSITQADQTLISVLGNGFDQTLYSFDMDSETASACNGKCAEVWPPITISKEEAATLSGDLGTITRTSGLLQLTFKGIPVYLFNLDRVAGDIKGDGIGGVWHIIKM
jgi:predicted lipoprotein with Yx(FWY)xxD motif